MADDNADLPQALDGALADLAAATIAAGPLFDPGENARKLPGGLMLHADPAMTISGTWASPAGRTLEIAARIDTPGGWLALHIPLPARALAHRSWLALIARTSAVPTPQGGAVVIRPSLRSGTPDGFRDHFMSRAILAQAQESDHAEVICPPRAPAFGPDLTLAPWNELVLFLPAGRSFHLMLHALRLVAV